MMSYETWCQLALLAFPRDYRRRRGAEMLTTLLDGARPGHTRPSVRELLTIVDSGWRCRLRLRPGVGPLVLAICSALTAAILGGTAAAWLAWALTAPALPSSAEVEAIGRAVVGAAPSEVCRTAVPYHLDFDGEDLCRDGRGVELIFHDVQASSPQHLNLEGWHLTRAERHSSIGYRDHHRLLAYRTDLQMIVRIDGSGEVQLVVSQAESPIVLPATIAGAVLCGLGGWLLNARLGRRCPGRPGFMAGVVVVGVGAIQAFLPQCFYALVEFIGGYVNTGQPDPVWWPLGWLPIRILAGMGVVATIALLAASLLPMPPDKLALRRHPSTAVE